MSLGHSKLVMEVFSVKVVGGSMVESIADILNERCLSFFYDKIRSILNYCIIV